MTSQKKSTGRTTPKKAKKDEEAKVLIRIDASAVDVRQGIAFEKRAGIPFNQAAAMMAHAEANNGGLPMSIIAAVIELGWTQEGREYTEDDLLSVKLSELDLDLVGND